VTGVRNHGNEKEVAFTQGGQTRTVRGEVLLVAAGRKANLEGINLAAAGVEHDGRGLKLNERLRTTQKHIFGAGDVTGTYQLTHAAGYEGAIVLTNAVFHLRRKARYANMPWVTYVDPELASIGMNEKSARAAGVDYKVWSEEFSKNDRGLAEGRTMGRIKVLLDDKGHPVGVQILGPEAGELLSEWVSVMNGRVSLSTLASAVHPYPTLGEINKRVAANFFATKVFSENVKEMLMFFFGLKGRACGQDTSFPDAPGRL
jgi:pyruvate/2-oxoglutarate dehydrogenase complex dihydrolipoamide dehydrogenase (E3) component